MKYMSMEILHWIEHTLVVFMLWCLLFFCDRGLNPGLYIYYALSLSTELSSRRQKMHNTSVELEYLIRRQKMHNTSVELEYLMYHLQFFLFILWYLF